MQRTAKAQEESLIIPDAAFRDRIHLLLLQQFLRRPVRRDSHPGPVRLPSILTVLQMAPVHGDPGANPNILQSFKSYPLPMAALAGDGLNTGSFTWATPKPDQPVDQHREDRLRDL